MKPKKTLVKTNNSMAMDTALQDALHGALQDHTETSPSAFDVVCEQCQTGEYLVFEQILKVGRTNTGSPAWNVDCWCGNCEQFYGLRTTKRPRGPFRHLHTKSPLSRT